MARNVGWRKWLGGALTALLLVAGLSVASLADLRIVTVSEDEKSEVLVKSGRILSRLDAESWFMIDCVSEEVTYVFSPEYWRGPISELGEALDAQLAEVFQAVPEDSEAAGLFGALFGSRSTPGTTQVRVTPEGDETIAGYRATQYRVETGDGRQWKTHELIWVSSDLLREIEAEVGSCTHVMMDFSQKMASLVPLGDTATVYNDSAYQALFRQGFPMRSIMKMTFFGIEFDVESEVVEVSRAPLSEDDFAVPASFRRVESLSEFLED